MNNPPSHQGQQAGGVPAEKLEILHLSSKSTPCHKAVFEELWKERQIMLGVYLSAVDASLDEDRIFNYQRNNNLVEFGFFLEGEFVNNLTENEIGLLSLENKAGVGGVGYLPEVIGTARFKARTKYRFMHVHVAPEVLNAMLRGEMDGLHPDFRELAQSGGKKPFAKRRRLAPSVQAVANQLFFAMSGNICLSMYLEGKVLELLGLCLADEGQPPAGKAVTLTPRERDVFHAIREELEKRYESPPTLAELSQKYSMGCSKIQSGFRSLFGVPVYGFIKEYRLQKARTLFAEGNMGVSEVAWAIGYTNVSHFSAGYKQRFGVQPKAFLKSIRSRM